MTVSDETAGGSGKPRKPVVKLSDAQYKTIRTRYESGELALPDLAGLYGVSLSNLEKRKAREQWLKGDEIVRQVSNELRATTVKTLQAKVGEVAERIGNRVMEDLQPWIEKEKRAHVKDAVKRAKRRLKQLDALADCDDEFTAKDAAYIAKSVDTYDSIKRRNLGMADGTAVMQPLSLTILTNQAAVAVNAPQV